MSLGTAFAQFLNVIFSPLITRIYSPNEMGIFFLYTSILNILLISASLKYEYSIPIAKNKIISINTIALSILILFITSILSTLILLILQEQILGLFNAEKLGNLVFLIPVGLLLAGLYTILLQWALRTKNFKKISITKLFQGLGQNLSQIVLGLIKFGSAGLIIGQVIGKCAGSLTLFRKLLSDDPRLLKNISLRKIRWVFKRYRHFPLLTLPSQLLSRGGLELPVFFLTSIFSTAVVGQYGLANLIVNIPVVLIGTAIGDVFYAEAAANGKSDPKSLLKLSNQLVRKLVLLGIAPTLILIVFSPILFSFFFGEEWYDAGVFSQILAFLAFFRLVFTPVSRVFLVFEKHSIALFTNVLRVLFVLVSFGATYYFNLNAFYAVSVYAVAMSIVYLMTYIFARRIILKQIENVSNP